MVISVHLSDAMPFAFFVACTFAVILLVITAGACGVLAVYVFSYCL